MPDRLVDDFLEIMTEQPVLTHPDPLIDRPLQKVDRGFRYWMVVLFVFGVVVASDHLSAYQTGLNFPPIDPSLSPSEQVLIRAIQQSNPKTPIELVRAMKAMVEVEQFDQARFLMQQVERLQLSDQQAFELYEQVGVNFFLELHANKDLQPSGRLFAKRIMASASQVANSPERIQQLVGRLSNADISVRSEAFRSLRRLGPVAAAEILDGFTDPARESEFPYLRGAIKSMGEDALPPLLAAARADHARLQIEAIRALGSFRTTQATDVLYRNYFSRRFPQEVRWVALDGLCQQGVASMEALDSIDRSAVEQRFYLAATDWMRGKQAFNETLTGTISWWEWDLTSQRLMVREVPLETASRLYAAQLAADLYEISPEDPRHRRLFALSQLESIKRISGPAIPVDKAEVERRLGDLEIAELDQMLSDAIKWGLIPAATACCELLGERGTADLLYPQLKPTSSSAANAPRALIDALRVGERYLQFAALQAIIKLDPTTPYPGSSYALTVAAFLANSDGQQSAMVADRRLEFAQSYAALMQASRVNGRAVNSSRELFNLVVDDPDVTMLLISETIDRPTLNEFINLIRNDIRTRRLPIGIFTYSDEYHLIENTPITRHLTAGRSSRQYFDDNFNGDGAYGEVEGINGERIQNGDPPTNPQNGLERRNDRLDTLDEIIADPVKRDEIFNRGRRLSDRVFPRSDNQAHIARLLAKDSLLVAFPPSLDPAIIASQIRQLQRVTGSWQFNGIDQQLHARVATEWLARLANDRSRYHFYELAGQQQILAQLIYRAGLSELGADILGSLGNASSQRELLNFISQDSFPLDNRQQAMTAFLQSVERTGVLLTRAELSDLYVRYESSVARGAEDQQLYRGILEALESRSDRLEIPIRRMPE